MVWQKHQRLSLAFINERVKISTKVRNPKWSVAEMPLSSQTVLASFASVCDEYRAPGIMRTTVEEFIGSADLIWSWSGQ